MNHAVLHGNGLVEGVVLHQVQDGRKGLVLDNLQVVGDFCNGWLDVTSAFVASAFQTSTWDKHASPLLHHSLQGALVLRHSVGVDEWSHVVVFVQGVANADLLVRLGELVAHLVVDAAVNDEASRGGATLTTRSNSAKHRRGNDHLEVRFRGDDDGVVSAQLQEGATETSSDSLCHNFAHADRACGRHEGNATVCGHHFTHSVIAVDDAACSSGEVVGLRHLVPNVLARDGAQRCFF